MLLGLQACPHLMLGGQLHNFFHLLVKTFLRELKGSTLVNMQAKLSNIKYCIMDELSMFRCKMLHAIDCRLRQAIPEFIILNIGCMTMRN